MGAPDGSPVLIGNRYRLEERIGAGAMGVVWRAIDELLGRTVALKELLAVTSGTSTPDLEQSRQRLLREGRIGARLQHPHVITMFDVVIHEECPWLVMEYLPSESLAARLMLHGPLQATEAADIGRQMADGLAAAHLAGVVHRDVKPGNVLIAANGLVKLTDFGVSRAVDEVQLTRTGVIAGTPAYLAPEVAQGREPRAASDVYALGATLYTAVEGEPPFGLDDNAYALLHRVATDEPRPPRQAGPLADILMRLLSADADQRPSAIQARDLLAAVAAGHVDQDATPTGLPPTDGTPKRADAGQQVPADGPPRRPRAAALLGVLVLVLVLTGGAAVVALTSESVDVAAAPPAARTSAIATSPAATSPAAESPIATSPAAESPIATSPAAESPVVASSAAPSPRPPPAPRGHPPSNPGPASTSEPAAAAVTAPASVTEPVAFVQRYYALLPGNTDAAFGLLGPRARSQSGGVVGFESFYGRMQSVTVQNPRSVGDNTVTAVVRFVQKDGTSSNEPYRFVMRTDGSGRMIMESFSKA